MRYNDKITINGCIALTDVVSSYQLGKEEGAEEESNQPTFVLHLIVYNLRERLIEQRML